MYVLLLTPLYLLLCANLLCELGFAPAIATQEPEVADAVWNQYVPGALADGSLKAVPPPLVAGHGLESVQLAMEKQKEGVSAKKVVVLL